MPSETSGLSATISAPRRPKAVRDLAGYPAVVTGAAHPTALGAARSLRRAGARVYGVTQWSEAPATRSRVWETITSVHGSAAERVDSLIELAERFDRPPFLLPTQDSVVEEISRRRAELEGKFRFVLPSHDTVQLFLDKSRFYAWGRSLHLPLPESRVATSPAELRNALDELRYPMVVKPRYRTEHWDRVSPVEKMVYLERPGDLDSVRFDLFEVAHTYTVSEWIPGSDSNVHFCLAYCDPPGQVSALYTGRKLLQYPPRMGSTAICVGVENRELEELTRRVFGLARMQGLASLEVKYGPEGTPFITEPTIGRPNLQSGSAARAGRDLHALAMARAGGHDLMADLANPKNCLWIEERGLKELLLSEGPRSLPWRLLVRELFRVGRVRGAYWDWRDPMPSLALARRASLRLVRGVFSRTRELLRPGAAGPSDRAG